MSKASPAVVPDADFEQTLARVAAVDVAKATGWCVSAFPTRIGRGLA